MKSIPYLWSATDSTFTPCEPAVATHLKFRLPGPVGQLLLPVMIGGSRKGTGNWTWNGDVDKPTLKPSIKTTTHGEGGVEIVCHVWLNDGMVQFLDDCTHELRGQTVGLMELDEEDES
jgi:hypothetical protein